MSEHHEGQDGDRHDGWVDEERGGGWAEERDRQAQEWSTVDAAVGVDVESDDDAPSAGRGGAGMRPEL